MNTNDCVLVVDDELSVRRLIQEVVRKAGYSVFLAENGREAVEKARQLKPAVIVMDIKMPVMDGMEAFEIIRGEQPHTAVILMTAHGTVDTAVEAMKNGAFDYLVKPYNVAELRIILERAFQLRRLRDEVTALRSEVQDHYRLGNIVGTSAVMQEVYKKIGRVAQTNATVLITGESGSGKELIAKIIHNNSLRRDCPFVKVNCGALPEGLLESELFGYEKGAFTGAVARKPGRFELADRGTIFFDEIGELSLALQVKLLGVLQEREFERVGGTETIKVDVRIIAATNRDLEARVRGGTFREDLYYRLKVVPIHVPPLRERPEDIPLLIDYFLGRLAAEAHREPPLLTAEAAQLLRRYPWPGNVRELTNALERAVIMSSGVIGPNDLPGLVADSAPPQVAIPETGTLRDIMHRLEKQIIARTLRTCGGNRGKTAQSLDISRRALQYKIDEHGLGKAVLEHDQAAD